MTGWNTHSTDVVYLKFCHTLSFVSSSLIVFVELFSHLLFSLDSHSCLSFAHLSLSFQALTDIVLSLFSVFVITTRRERKRKVLLRRQRRRQEKPVSQCHPRSLSLFVKSRLLTSSLLFPFISSCDN